MSQGYNLPDRRTLNRNVLAIVLPLALQNVLGMLVNLCDTVMVGRLGQDALAGVSQANQVFFIVAMTVPGIAAGAGVLLSQAWGKRDIDRMDKILAYACRTALVFALAITLVSAILPESVMRIYTADPAAVSNGARYLRIVAWSYLFYTATTITTGVLRCVRSVRICLYAALVSLVLNIGGNYLLIEGHLGMPALGIRGAAVATLLARAGEFCLIVIYVSFYEKNYRIRLRNLLRLEHRLAGLFFRTAVPVILNEMFWGLGVSVQAAVIGRMGNHFVSANAIASSVTQIATVVCQGFSAAACIITGNNIGAGNLRMIPGLKKYFQRLAVITGGIAAGLVILLMPVVPVLYSVEEGTLAAARALLMINAFILPFMELQSMNMMGLLRGAGDVRFQMANDLVFLWGLTVPLGMIAGLVLHAPVPVVYCCLKCDQVIKVFTSEWRLRRCAWIHDLGGDGRSGKGRTWKLKEVEGT